MKHACEKCETCFDVAESGIIHHGFVRYSCNSPRCPRCPKCGFAIHGVVNGGVTLASRLPESYKEIRQCKPVKRLTN